MTCNSLKCRLVLRCLTERGYQLFIIALKYSRCTYLCIVIIGTIPTPTKAQDRILGYGSLKIWEENSWLLFLDRNDSFGGRFSEKGILKRFTPLVDSKYQLDVLGSQFDPVEDFYWNSKTNGVRWKGTSATTLTLTSAAEFKTSGDLNGSWKMDARFNQLMDSGFEGSAIRLQFSRELERSSEIFSGMHLDPHKAGGDFWIGAKWKKGANQITGRFTILDPLNDFLHVTLDAALHPHGDTTVVYTQQPLAIRVGDHLRLSNDIRLEVYGMLMPAGQSIISSKSQNNEGFTLKESARYLGGLIEWTPTEYLLLAGSYTEISADSDRANTHTSFRPLNNQLLEQTHEITAFSIFRPNPNWTLSLTGIRKRMLEKRTFQSNSANNINYLLTLWMSKLDISYTTTNGFMTKGGFLHSNSKVPEGKGDMNVTKSLAGNFYRFLLNFGWKFDNSAVVLGGAYDYTSNATHRWIWGTASGRFSMYW